MVVDIRTSSGACSFIVVDGPFPTATGHASVMISSRWPLGSWK
jgi:hypothetical protein